MLYLEMEQNMKVELFDTLTDETLVTADVSFGLDVAVVNSCEGMDILEFERFLENRAELPRDYDIDDVVLKSLNLYHRKHEFGRMSEAKILYAMLNSFAKENDNLEVRPLKTELVSMVALDWRYSNIYIWKSKEDLKL